MPEWNIYRGDREYAQTHGDPLIGTVSAPTKQEAERIASREFNLTHGPWAQERHDETPPDQRMTFGEHVSRIARVHRLPEDSVRDVCDVELQRAMKSVPYEKAVYQAACAVEAQISTIREAIGDTPQLQGTKRNQQIRIRAAIDRMKHATGHDVSPDTVTASRTRTKTRDCEHTAEMDF